MGLVPMSPANDSIYQRIYNRCFREVSHALTYEKDQLERIYREGHRAFLGHGPRTVLPAAWGSCTEMSWPPWRFFRNTGAGGKT